jgi:hypothetical protein
MKTLSRRALEELSSLQAAMRRLAEDRNAALRLFLASRNAATRAAQREFWLEFSWIDQEYRFAVRRLALFCAEHCGTYPRGNEPST